MKKVRVMMFNFKLNVYDNVQSSSTTFEKGSS